MGNNAGQLALLAAGYFLGKSNNLRTVLLVAGGVAYGRLTAQGSNDDSSDSLLSRLSSSGLMDSARDVVTSTASKGVESLSKNLQSRTEELRSHNGSRDSDQEAEGSTESEEPTESEDSAESEKSTESGDK